MNLRLHRPALAALLALTACTASPPRDPDPVPTYLAQSWRDYAGVFLQPDGYVLDRQRDGGRVTSEGQAYALLRAAWLGEREDFARVLTWTDTHLRRPDGLYSWLWSPAGGVLDPNTATDADQDIAFALLLAAHAFAEPKYRAQSAEILRAIRANARLEWDGGWVPAAGNWAVAERIANPSYFAPYAWEYFDRADPGGGWKQAIDSAYDLIAAARRDARLVPDFFVVDTHGALAPLPLGSPHSPDFGHDAVRTYWRVALDCRLHGRPRACADPVGTDEMVRLLRLHQHLPSRVRVDGEPVDRFESLSFYGALLPALRLNQPSLADAVRRSRLDPDALRAIHTDDQRYYDLNWAWFGLAMEDGWLVSRTPAPEVMVPTP